MDHFGLLSGHFWYLKVTLGPPWGHFGVAFGMRMRLWGHFGIFFAYDGDFLATLGTQGDHVLLFEGGFGDTLGSLWGYLGSTCGIWGDFGVTLGLL